jgi:hypothetical protein
MVSYFVAPTLQSQRSVAGVTARASSATGFRRNYARCPRRCGARSTWNSGVRRRDAAACRCEPTVVPRGTRANQVSDDCSRASGAAPPVPNAGRVGFAWNSDSRARPAPATWNDPSALVVAHARLQTRGVPRGTRTRPLHRASCWLRSHRGCSTWNSRLRAQKRGRFAGTPGLRAYRSGHGSTCSSAWYRKPSDHDEPTARPSRASPGAVHRDVSGGAPESPSGGSLTASVPPTRMNGAPHSAVTAGGPKPRATTRSNAPRR